MRALAVANRTTFTTDKPYAPTPWLLPMFLIGYRAVFKSTVPYAIFSLPVPAAMIDLELLTLGV
jgi:hypothetical protein